MHPLPSLRAALLACAVLSTPCAAAPAPLPASTSPSLPPPARVRPISVATLKAVTRTLSSDAFEGRAPTTPAEQKTVAYIIDQMKRAGLKPGNKGRWTQPVPLVELTPDVTTPMTITGGRQPVSFAFKTDMVVGTYRVEPHTTLSNSEMVFVGFGIHAPEKGWNDYAGIDVRGKTVVMLVNDPDYDMQGLDGPFNGRAMTYYGRWTYKFEEAARQGAAAALIIHDTYPAAYPWSVVVSSWSGAKLELDDANGHGDQTQVNGWITGPAARALFDAAGKPLDRLIAAAKQPGFRAVPLGVKASLRFDTAIRRQASQNVVGILPGRTAPDEHVLYTAHWDHLGHCEPVNGDDICNGAVDNATGMAGLIALARAHSGAGAARRSIVFLAVTAEEAGMLGSRYYAESPVFPLATTAGGVNMDGLNIHGRTRDVTLIGGGKSDLEVWLTRAATAQGRVVKPEPTPEKGSFYRSDHFSFARLGVPMAYAESGDDLVKGGVTSGRAQADDYTANRYHKPADEYDPAWDWSGAVEDLQIYYRIGRELADSAAWPNWYPTAEFRAIRDESRKAAPAPLAP
ncbi:MAG TPA: M28 family metallopeptidase [Sphingobium sp.]